MRTLDEPTPCHKRADLYDTLMDHAGGYQFRAARKEALDLCLGCPIRAECWTENADEPWVQALNPPQRLCRSCGHQFAVPRQAPNKRYCSPACGVADRTKPITSFEDIPKEIRAAHAKHVAMKKRGESIPNDIARGESTYQQMRHVARKARKVAA